MSLVLSKAEITATHVATALTKEALASRLRMMAKNPRTFDKIERTAFLLEAARRLEAR